MTKVYISIPHALSWEEALNRRVRLAHSMFLKLGFKNLDIKWERNAAEFAYWKNHKRKTKSSVSLTGVIAIAKKKVLVSARSHNGNSAAELAEKISQSVKEAFSING